LKSAPASLRPETIEQIKKDINRTCPSD